MDAPRQQRITRACRRFMRPLVALLLKNGVMYRDFCAWCKEVYVQVAAEDYGKGGRPTNQSRIALLTGLDRKEIKRLRDHAEAGKAISDGMPPGRLSRVLSAWYQDTDFAAAGAPRPLDDDAFADLCARFGGDVPVSAIRKELLAVGAVRPDANGRLVAVSRYYMPDRAEPGALLRSADVLHDLGDTLVHNLYRGDDQPSRFEGRATNLNINAAHAPKFRDFLEQRGQAFLEEVDAWLSEHEARGQTDEETIRLGLGMYWLQGMSEANKS